MEVGQNLEMHTLLTCTVPVFHDKYIVYAQLACARQAITVQFA